MRRGAWALFALGLIGAGPTLAGPAHEPSIAERVAARVAAQRAIEEVYWRHRIWPAENPGPKPPLAAILSDADLRARVEDSLAKSSALAELWQRPITAAQLQAELDRMAASTHDATVLSELFAALGNDARTIAETLARQTLADRLIREWYARDARYHGALKRQAMAALASCADARCMTSLGGEYRETVWRVRDASARPAQSMADDGIVPLDASEWKATRARLAKLLGGARDRLPISKLSDLQESAEDFSVTAVLSQAADELTTATVTWAKEPFDAWWSVERGTLATTFVDADEDQAFALPAIPDANCVDDTWSAPMPLEVPDPRYAHTAVWTGTEMIIWGGDIDIFGPSVNTGGRYNPSTDTWTATSIGANVPVGRSGHTAVWTGTQMIVWGGSDNTVGFVNSGGRYDPSTDTWTATSTGANVPAARELHTAVWTGSEMIVWGGRNAGLLNTGGRYSPSSDAWTAMSTTSAPVARFDHTAVWTGSVMVVWGGFDNTNVFNTGGRYNPSTNSWTSTSIGTNVPTARRGHATVWTGSTMVVWSGLTSAGPVNTGGRYNPTTNAWTATATTAGVPVASNSYTAVWSGSEMIVWLNADNAGGRYNPTTNAWTAVSTGPNAHESNFNHTAVWTGSEMIVWGGGLAPVYNTGARYSPATNTWVKTSTGTTVPTARTRHSAVWTGSEMVVWGGNVNVSYKNTGGRYVPATNAWTPTSIGANVPAARGYHTATWTGREMVVWGGIASGVYVNTGGRYDPALDAWSAVSTASAPDGRSYHTAIWSGTQMIVWGGFGAAGALNSGGRYAPAENAWSATSTGANLPAPRIQHTAVWAGNTMIVWGGSNLNSGGRYDPVADTWLPTSTGANVPDTRAVHVAVWTGSEMVVWGGIGGPFSLALKTGGRYEPVADTWTATAVPPPAVTGAGTALWTGSQMLVWGGLNDTESNGGGRYTPASNSWTATSTGTNVPQARSNHTAVWSGTEMLVWGGEPLTATGGGYCACASPVVHYRDLDGDGYGNAAITTMACAGSAPAGWVAVGTDCDDTNGAIHPGATELCNDLDDDCSNGVDDGFAIPGLPALSLGSAGGLSWSAVLPSTGYDLVRGDLVTLVTTAGNFTAATTDCLDNDIVATFGSDGDTPAAGGGFWYLVRAVNCHASGSWNSVEPSQQGSRDAEIAASAGACP